MRVGCYIGVNIKRRETSVLNLCCVEHLFVKSLLYRASFPLNTNVTTATVPSAVCRGRRKRFQRQESTLISKVTH